MEEQSSLSQQLLNMYHSLLDTNAISSQNAIVVENMIEKYKRQSALKPVILTWQEKEADR
uniref:Uncharacterized protein n=1 Tax=Roseihalotalea indica TaxID=2867963 RepID=A0AA49GR40_9BACT|nr:hypothetical protein K4G66_04580 [Tunicatimonas sp. TK19036]